jgi:hypothetical protein
MTVRVLRLKNDPTSSPGRELLVKSGWLGNLFPQGGLPLIPAQKRVECLLCIVHSFGAALPDRCDRVALPKILRPRIFDDS